MHINRLILYELNNELNIGIQIREKSTNIQLEFSIDIIAIVLGVVLRKKC